MKTLGLLAGAVLLWAGAALIQGAGDAHGAVVGLMVCSLGLCFIMAAHHA